MAVISIASRLQLDDVPLPSDTMCMAITMTVALSIFFSYNCNDTINCPCQPHQNLNRTGNSLALLLNSR